MGKRWKLIRNILVVATEAGGLALWLRLPEDVPIHWSKSLTPDRWGNKLILLLIFILPLLPFIHRGELPEIHSNSEESREILERAKNDEAQTQAVCAILECGLFWIILALTVYLTR